MDPEFQQRYQDAEQAFAEARYADARGIASDLLTELDEAPTDAETQTAVIGWRAFVALLLGNIELHGLGQPDTAARHFQLVLDSQPHDTLAELAQQGLTWATQPKATTPMPSPSPPQASEGSPQQTTPQQPSPEPAQPAEILPLPDLLRDPFLTGTTQSPASAVPAGSTAMPWLDDLAANDDGVQATAQQQERSASPTDTTADLPKEIEDEPEPSPQAPPESSNQPEATAQPQASAEPQPTPSPTPTPAASPEPAPSSAPEPEPTPDPQPVTESEPEQTAPPEPDPMEVLGDYLLRVRISEITDSNSSETPDPEEADQDRSASSISEKLLDLWRRLNRR